MAMASTSTTSTLFQLLVIFLGFSHLAFFNAYAVPTTRIGKLKNEPQFLPLPENADMVSNGRLVVELNDYPGSGANNRHTPRQQFGRCIIDC